MANNLNSILKDDCKRPVIIWGTGIAGQISRRVLLSLHFSIVAAGDNNIRRIGNKLIDIPILSAQEIKRLYPRAFIVVSTFFRDVSEKIIAQLKMMNDQFAFCRFEEIELLYETEYLKRNIRNREKICRIINNIQRDKEYVWKRKVNKQVLPEFRYAVYDKEAQDLKEMLSGIYGLKNLLLISGSGRLRETTELATDLFEYENIGHIILVIENISCEDRECLDKLLKKVFYLICSEATDERTKLDLIERGFIVHTRKITEDAFFRRKANGKIRLTEQHVVKSVLKYVNETNENINTGQHWNERPVHIVQLFNGLANQALMYLFGRYLEEESGGIVIFDDTILSLDVRDEQENERRIRKWTNLEEAEKVHTLVSETKNKSSFYKFKRAELAEVIDRPIRLLSDYFTEETWRAYLEKIKKKHTYKYAQSFPLGQVLIEYGVDMTIVRDNIMPDDFFAVNQCCCLDAYILEMPCLQNSVTDFLFHSKHNLYCIGIWATGKIEDCYFHNRRWVRKQLPFHLELNDQNMNYAEKISKADGIMIHIRRGDFAFMNMSADAEYFRNSIRAMEDVQEYENKKYFVFSDDLEWCMENDCLLGTDKVKSKVFYVSINTGINNYLDLYLMSLGKALIPTPGSSFSYIAMLISSSIEKCIDVPRYIYNLECGIEDFPAIINV